MTKNIDFYEGDCEFVMHKRFSTVVVTVRRYLWSDNPQITVSTCTKSGKHLLYARTYEIVPFYCAENPTATGLEFRRAGLRVEDIGRIKALRVGFGVYGTWKSAQTLIYGLFDAGITSPEHWAGSGSFGEPGLIDYPEDRRGYTFMAGQPVQVLSGV